MLDVCLAGTGGTVPLENRWLSCLWIELQGEALLVDCGEGTQIALRASKRKLSRLKAILLTHMHADHVSGLPGLLLTLGNTGKTEPLTIAGPAGTADIVLHLLAIAPFLPYPLRVIELPQNEPEGFDLCGFHIRTLPLSHGAPCLGYSVALSRKPVFDPQKAAELGVPKTLYQTLHSGSAVEVDGRTVTPDMVVLAQRLPVKIVYCTDTGPVDGLPSFAANADLFVCEGMHGDEALREKTTQKGHMLIGDAAAIAAKAGVTELWLTHFSPALTHPQQYLPAAQAVFPNAVMGADGLCKTLL